VYAGADAAPGFAAFTVSSTFSMHVLAAIDGDIGAGDKGCLGIGNPTA